MPDIGAEMNNKNKKNPNNKQHTVIDANCFY